MKKKELIFKLLKNQFLMPILVLIGLKRQKQNPKHKTKRIIQFVFKIVPGKSLTFIKESNTVEELYRSKKYGSSKEYSISDDPFFTGIVKETSFDKDTKQTTITVQKEGTIHHSKVEYIKKTMTELGWLLIKK